MAIYHLSIQIISRTQNKSAVAAAAYRAGEKLKNIEQDKTYDFSKKHEVVFNEILLPVNAPKEYSNRETLWNEVQRKEKHSNAQLAREINIALPKELNREQQIKLARQYINDQFVSAGMIADWALHDKEDGNPHLHIMLTVRSLKKNGEWAPKKKSAYKLDENGKRIPKLDKDGKQKIGARGRKLWERTTTSYNDWNNKDKAEIWRKAWSDTCNKYLSSENHIDHRSYERQGVEKIPTIHEGYVARKMVRQGTKSDLVEYNNKVRESNKKIEELRRRANKLLETIKALQKHIKEMTKRLEEKFYERIRNEYIAREIERTELEIKQTKHEIKQRERGTSQRIGATEQDRLLSQKPQIRNGKSNFEEPDCHFEPKGRGR